MKLSFSPSRFQYALLTLLTVLAICWMLLLTGYKEYWGFLQSPEVYGFLKKEYPQWMRDYVRTFHLPVMIAAFALYLCWSGWTLCLVVYSQRSSRRIGYLILLLMVTALLAFSTGVQCANNFINFLDRGELHGNTHLRTRH
ncbi:MAG: hypothetical protein AAGC73_03595 [Verrucomicrobiota bacterium]